MDKFANRIPPIGSTVTLCDGRTDIVVCGWYAPGKGGWKIMLNELGIVGLRNIKTEVKVSVPKKKKKGYRK